MATIDSPSTAAVLDAALEQFAARGYEATTLDAVGAAAGVDRPQLALLFASRARLFAGVLDRELVRLHAQVAEAVGSPTGGQTTGRAVGRALEALCARAQRDPASWRLVLLADFGSYGETGAREELREDLRVRLRDLLAPTLPLAAHERPPVALVLAAMVASLFEAGLPRLLAGEPVIPAVAVARALDRLLATG